jgi:dihydroorotase
MRKPELGTIAPGSAADVAIFRLEEGEFVFRDIHMNGRQGNVQLVNTLTMVDGEVLPQLPESPLHPWATIPEIQRGVKWPHEERL